MLRGMRSEEPADPSLDNVAEELTEMGLWEQCKEAFEKWAPGGTA